MHQNWRQYCYDFLFLSTFYYEYRTPLFDIDIFDMRLWITLPYSIICDNALYFQSHQSKDTVWEPSPGSKETSGAAEADAEPGTLRSPSAHYIQRYTWNSSACSVFKSKHADIQSFTNMKMQGVQKEHAWHTTLVCMPSRAPETHVLIDFLIILPDVQIFSIKYWAFFSSVSLICLIEEAVLWVFDGADAQCHNVRGRIEISGSAGDREHARPEAPSGFIQTRVWRCTKPAHNVLPHLSENSISPMSQLIRIVSSFVLLWGKKVRWVHSGLKKSCWTLIWGKMWQMKETAFLIIRKI